jgi:hypothetical protein
MTIKESGQGSPRGCGTRLATSKARHRKRSPEVSGKLVGRLPEWRGSEVGMHAVSDRLEVLEVHE